MEPKSNPRSSLRYSPGVLVDNWQNERVFGEPSQSSNKSPEYETSYNSHFKQPPSTREEYREEAWQVAAVPSNRLGKHCALTEKKEAQWRAETNYLDETKTEYESEFLRARPKPPQRALTEEEMDTAEELYHIEKAAALRNQRNRYGPRDFQPKVFPSAPHNFMLQGKCVHFTPTGELIQVKPERPSGNGFNAYLDSYNRSRTLNSKNVKHF